MNETRVGFARWLATALGFLAAAYALVLLFLTFANANGIWFSTPSSISVAGKDFEIVRGRGHQEGDAIVLEATDPTGLAIISSRIEEFSAATYPRVEWNVVSGGRVPPKLTFLWRTRERPNRTFSKPLTVVGGNVGRFAPLQLAGSEGWDGTIIGVALTVQGSLTPPLTIDGVSVPGVSALTSAREVLGQWTRGFSILGDAIAFPFDSERDDHLSLLTATVVAQLLALSACVLLARRRRARVDPRVVWAILVAGWLVLDFRWQVNQGRELLRVAERFAGKTDDEKHRAADDARLYEMVQEVRAILPAPPVRIFVVAEGGPLRVRSAYFLYPHNVIHDVGSGKQGFDLAVVKTGDFLLLFPNKRVGYDREKRLLAAADGIRRGAEMLHESDEGSLLLRVE